MTLMHKVIFVLTGLLILLGLIMLISGTPLSLKGGDTYGSEKEYEEARGKGEVARNAPDLPACAEEVEIVAGDDGATQRISFVCTNAQERAAFVAYVKNGFTWNLFEGTGGRITLEAPEAQ